MAARIPITGMVALQCTAVARGAAAKPILDTIIIDQFNCTIDLLVRQPPPTGTEAVVSPRHM